MVQHIDVKNESGAPLLTLQGKELEAVLSHPALPPDSKGGPAAEIAPGEAVIAYMWIDLVKGAPFPRVSNINSASRSPATRRTMNWTHR